MPMNRRRAALLLAASLALAACSPAGPGGTTGTASPRPAATTPGASATAAATPTPEATPTPAPTNLPTAPPAQAATGQADAQAGAGALADERLLMACDLAGDAAPAAALRLRKLTQADPDLAGADKPLTFAEGGRDVAAKRRADLRAALGARVPAALATAIGQASTQARTAGGTIRVATGTVERGGVAMTVKVVRAVDASGAVVHGFVRATSPDGALVLTRGWTAQADGAAIVSFSRAEGPADAQRKSAWSRTEAADGNLTGSGAVALVGEGGKARTLIVSIKGTAAAPQLTLKDPQAKLEAEVVVPATGAPTATLVRLDAGGMRIPVTVTAP